MQGCNFERRCAQQGKKPAARGPQGHGFFVARKFPRRATDVVMYPLRRFRILAAYMPIGPQVVWQSSMRIDFRHERDLYISGFCVR